MAKIGSGVSLLVLCGGKGSRVEQISDGNPKALLDIAGQDLLSRVLDHVTKDFVFDQIILLTGFRSEKIEAVYSDTKFNDIDVTILREENALGTGGAIINAFKYFGPRSYLSINGDTIIDLNVRKFLHYCHRLVSHVGIASIMADDISDYGGIIFDDHKNLISFKEKSARGRGYVNTGMVYFSQNTARNLLSLYENILSSRAISLETEILVDKRFIKKVWVDENGSFLDVGTPKRVAETRVKFNHDP